VRSLRLCLGHLVTPAEKPIAAPVVDRSIEIGDEPGINRSIESGVELPIHCSIKPGAAPGIKLRVTPDVKLGQDQAKGGM
jgi:hypothetical protein